MWAGGARPAHASRFYSPSSRQADTSARDEQRRFLQRDDARAPRSTHDRASAGQGVVDVRVVREALARLEQRQVEATDDTAFVHERRRRLRAEEELRQKQRYICTLRNRIDGITEDREGLRDQFREATQALQTSKHKASGLEQQVKLLSASLQEERRLARRALPAPREKEAPAPRETKAPAPRETEAPAPRALAAAAEASSYDFESDDDSASFEVSDESNCDAQPSLVHQLPQKAASHCDDIKQKRLVVAPVSGQEPSLGLTQQLAVVSVPEKQTAPETQAAQATSVTPEKHVTSETQTAQATSVTSATPETQEKPETQEAQAMSVTPETQEKPETQEAAQAMSATPETQEKPETQTALAVPEAQPASEAPVLTAPKLEFVASSVDSEQPEKAPCHSVVLQRSLIANAPWNLRANERAAIVK